MRGGGTCSSELCSLLWCQGSIQRVSESFQSCSGCLSIVSQSILACPVPSASLSRRVPEFPYSPFNIAFKTDATLWEWYEKPGNEWRARRFVAAISHRSDGQYVNLNKGCHWLSDPVDLL